MKKRKLGKTGIEIPEMGMGCWAIGGQGYGPVTEEVALRTLEAAWNSGVRFFDTADTYGEGRSEQLIAQFLKDKDRSEALIATKAGVDFYPSSLWKNSSGQPVASGHKKNFEPEYLKFACEQSLKRLDTDYIDLYQLHNPPLEKIISGEAVCVLAELKREGKIRHIGISVHTEEEALAALRDDRVESLQLIFNMLDQRMAKSVFAIAREKKVGVLAREPLACGLLTGKYKADAVFQKGDHRRRYSKEKLAADFEKIEKIKKLLASQILNFEMGLTLAQAALEFVLSEPAVSCVIPGAKSPEQLEPNRKAVNQSGLTTADFNAIRRIFEADPIFREHLLPSK